MKGASGAGAYYTLKGHNSPVDRFATVMGLFLG